MKRFLTIKNTTVQRAFSRLLGCCIFFGGLTSDLNAQKYDYIWLSGYGSSRKNDSAEYGAQFGNIKMDFDSLPVQPVYDSIGMNFLLTDVTMSDTNGNLLFYSNGIYVANYLDETIANGDSLDAGYVIYVWNPDLSLLGYKTPQGMIAIPDVANPNRYYLFHSFVDTGTDQGLYWSKILNTLVDMSANGGLGQVIYKNQPLVIDTLGYALQAVRHGNGRDWWLLVQKENTNCYYRILLDSAGPHVQPDLNCLGDSMPNGNLSRACFSPDGSKYVYLGAYSGLSIYDFDRCTGNLSNAINLPLPVIVASTWLGLGVAISPNNRYL